MRLGSFLAMFPMIFFLGCGGRTVGGVRGDGGTVDGQVRRDGGSPRTDGSSSNCDPVSHGWLQPVPLTHLDIIQQDEITEGQTMRIVAGLEYGGCDRFGQIVFTVDEPSLTITVQGYNWVATNPVACPEFLAYGEEYYAVADPAPGAWTVIEAPLNGPGLETSFKVSPCDGNMDCFCNAMPPPQGQIDDPCQFNCQCDDGLMCIQNYGFGGPFWSCGRNCTVGGDCDYGQNCRFYADGPMGMCGYEGIDECDHNNCPPGMECIFPGEGQVGSFCQANYPFDEVEKFCECDADCADGLICSDWIRMGEQQPVCVFHCRGDRECPGGYMCGAGIPDMQPICYTFWL